MSRKKYQFQTPRCPGIDPCVQLFRYSYPDHAEWFPAPPFGISGPHGIPPFRNGPVGFQNHRHNLPRTHKIRQLPEEWPFLMHRVKPSSLFLRQAHRFNRHDLESRLLNARKYFTLLPFTNRVGLDNRERTFSGTKSLKLQKLKFACIVTSVRRNR
jgi:hypothetical protein